MEYLKLNDLCNVITCGVAKRPEYVDKGIPFLSSLNVKENRLILNKYNFIKEEDHFTLTRYNKPEINDILYSRVGSYGEAAVVDIEFEFSVFVSLTLIKPKHNLINSRYLMWYLNSPKVRDFAKNNTTGVGVKNLNVSVVREYLVPLPPLATQKEIAEKLDKADALRKKDQELLKQYDELAQSIFIEMFGDPVQNEKGWEKNYLEDLTNLITDGKHGNCNDEKDSGYYFISAKDIFNGKINYSKSRQIPKSEFDEVDRRTNLQINDLVMVNTGATIGKMAVVENEILTRKTTFQKSVAVIKPLHNLINVNFLKYVFELRIDAFANIGSGTAIKNLLLSDMRKFKIISPPLDLQNQFAEKIKNIEAQKELVKKQAEESENLFQALLQESFNFS